MIMRKKISSFLVKGIELYKFKAKYSEINATALCLSNVAKYFSGAIIKKIDYTDISMTFNRL